MAFLAVADLFAILLVTLFPVFVRRFGRKWWTYLYLCAAPVWYCVLTELITGNLFQIQRLYLCLNLVAYYLIHLLLLAFFRNVKWPLLIGHLAFTLLALVEYYVYLLRGRSFMVQDFASAGTAAKVMGAYSFRFVFRVGLVLMAVVLSLYIVFLLPRVSFSRFSLARKGAVLLLVAALSAVLTNRTIMQHFEIAGVDLWNIEGNYQEEGYVFTLLSELQYLDREVPEGYSVETVKEVGSRLAEGSPVREDGVTPENIILIMNESWADFRVLSEEDCFDGITPYIDSLNENTVKGYVHVPVFGAGTANTEYEVLTGNSMSFFVTAECAYQLYTSEEEWGMASTLESQGYRTVAMHPFNAANWNRNIVYDRMGFESFYAIENWPWQVECIRAYPSDHSSYDAVTQLYRDKAPGEKLFTFLVTMQNHGGYTWEDYGSTVELPYDADYPEAEQYFSLIQESDRAFEELVEQFSAVDENTMIVMFGDHFPKVEDELYAELLGEPRDQLPLEKSQALYWTPFVIWTNYDIEASGNVKISANYFGSYIMELANLELTEYNKCLLDIYRQLPVIGYGMAMDAAGNWYALDALPAELDEVLNEYQILQHNNVFGGAQRVDELFTLP